MCISGIVYPKEQKFEFQYKLPTPLPENYEDELCLVEYYLEARIKHDNNVDNDTVARKEFSIINPLDLNEVIIPDIMVGLKIYFKNIYVENGFICPFMSCGLFRVLYSG